MNGNDEGQEGAGGQKGAGEDEVDDEIDPDLIELPRPLLGAAEGICVIA